MRKVEHSIAQETRGFVVFDEDTGECIGNIVLTYHADGEPVPEEPWIAFSVNTAMFPAAMRFFKTPREATEWIASGRYE